MSQDKIRLKAKVTEVIAGGRYKVMLENNLEIEGYVSGKMRVNRISILPGDIVDLEMSPYDLTKGRITYRHR